MAISPRALKGALLGLTVVAAGGGGTAWYAVQRYQGSLGPAYLQQPPAPESPTGLRAVPPRRFPHGLVVAAHPEAARVGEQVLKRGGSALDAAVAAQAALTLVEPQSSGLGGGAFLLYFDARTGTLHGYDGRETAPAGATPELFLGPDGKPLGFLEALVGGRSVGVPGVVRMLALAHARHGRQQWASLFSGAADLAQSGFSVTPRLNTLIGRDPVLPAMPALRRLYLDADGWPLKVGARLANPELAATLRTLAAEGPDAFYQGPLARAMVGAVRTARQPSALKGGLNLVGRSLGLPLTQSAEVPAPGTLSLEDLAGYRAVERAPLCVAYRGFQVCSAAPPAGGVSLLQALKLLERFDLKGLTPGSPEEAHLLVEALKLVDADRERWVADPNFAPVPTAGLLEPGYLKERSARISADTALKRPGPGQPPGALGRVDDGLGFEAHGTSHLVVVDPEGSVACLTTSVEFGFGSHLVAGGFVLNNQLTDFAFSPEKEGRRVLNAVEPGKRPRSSMSPTVVLDARTGRPVLAVGSPGGGRIIGYLLQVLVGVLDHGLPLARAIAMPHVLHAGGRVEVEDVGWASPAARDALVEALRAKGQEVVVTGENSGLHGVALGAELEAGIDPRREGEAGGY